MWPKSTSLVIGRAMARNTHQKIVSGQRDLQLLNNCFNRQYFSSLTKQHSNFIHQQQQLRNNLCHLGKLFVFNPNKQIGFICNDYCFNYHHHHHHHRSCKTSLEIFELHDHYNQFHSLGPNKFYHQQIQNQPQLQDHHFVQVHKPLQPLKHHQHYSSSTLISKALTTNMADDKDPNNFKRKAHVYDSLEHCRAIRTRSSAAKQTNTATSNNTTTKATTSTATKSQQSPANNGNNNNNETTTNATNIKTTNKSTTNSEDDSDTLDFVESLRSKSSSRSGKFHDTSMDGKPYNLKITTWNINGLRSWLARRSSLSFLAQDDADIYCFQEIKCANSKVPTELKSIPGYHCYFNGSDDGKSGVCCFSKQKPRNVTNGIGMEIYDKECRTITMEFQKYYVVNVYVPNSGRGLVRLDFRMKWDADFQNYIKELDSQKPVIVCGDLNVSHHEIDLANPKTNLKTAGFTIGERNNFSKLLDNVKLLDVFRFLNPDKKECYTYWTYMRNAREKNIGWRLDYFLISTRWTKKICDCIIRNDIYGSDHCPVSIYLSV